MRSGPPSGLRPHGLLEVRAQLVAVHEELGRLWGDQPFGRPERALENWRRLAELDPANVYAIYAARELLKASQQARVVMMGSGVGSLTLITDPTSIYSSVNLLAYTASKVALNAATVSFAKELEPFGVKVNAVEPGNVQTDLNGNTGVLTTEEGAATAIRMALIDQDGPTAGFFGSHGRQPW